MVRADQDENAPGRSQRYNLNKVGEFQEVEDLGGAMGARGIYTTLDDLAKWIIVIKKTKVGNAKIFRKTTSPYVLTNAETLITGFC